MKTNVWRGITAASGVLLGLVFLLGNLALDRKTDVSLFLGTTAPSSGSGDGTSQYFKSAYASADELAAAMKAHNIQSEEESCVLLKNKNNALPLKSTERKVTLFGRASADPVYRGQSGGAAFTGTSYHDAMKAAGFSINETLFSAYSSSSTKRVTSSYESVAAGASSPSTIGEEASSFYTSELKNSYASDYNDVAIVMLSRISGEGKDYAKKDADNVPQLSLHPEEADLLKMLKASKDAGQIKKIVLLVNSGNPFDLGCLEDDATYGIDAALFIGLPGNDGFTGVANVLTGAATPSGRLADTFAASSLSSPAMQNFGDMTFSNMTTLYKNKYVVYQEGVYVGYKYYESRYADAMLGNGNASGNYGVFANGKSTWNYADEMVYPFGYGLSYTSFDEQLQSVSWDRDAHKVKAVVTVKNNGSTSYSGKAKDVVQLYVRAPYRNGKVEKSAIQLIDFGKTKALASGEEDTITIEASDYLFASYDRKATNGSDSSKKGCYVFDEGDYYFAIGNGAHDALNATLAKQGVSGLVDPDGSSVSGTSAHAVLVSGVSYDNKTYAVSPYTGKVVSNLFDDMDLNSFIPNKITYLSRSDYSTFPSEVASFDATDAMKKLIDGHTYTTPSDAPSVSSYTFDAKNNIKFIEMKDVPLSGSYTDKSGATKDGAETWKSFLDQLSVADLCQIPGEAMGNLAIESVAYPANTSGDGPDGFQSGNRNLFVAEGTMACSYNKDLFAERGSLMGEDALWAGYGEIYGPGADLHRTPYGGRNFEYFSEEGNLAYFLGQKQVNAMRDKGLLSATKHFVGNDQETNRHGIATFIDEAAFRENNLRSFEGILSSENSYGLMSAYNRVGCVPDAASKAVQTSLLRNEWGWKGVNLTDSSKDAANYMYTSECLDAGTNFFNNDTARSSEVKTLLTKNKDGYLWGKARESAQYFFYSYLHSHVINGLTSTSTTSNYVPWWIPTVQALQYSLLGVTIVSAGLLGVSVYLSKKKEA